VPNAAFASGLLNGYFDTVTQERKRRDDNNLAAAQFLMQTGRVKDFNEILPLIGDMLTPMGASSTTGKKRGGKDQMQPQDLLAKFINPALAGQSGPGSQGTPGGPEATTVEGQAKPSFPAVGGAPGATGYSDPGAGRLLYTEDEAQQRTEAAQGRQQTRAVNVYEQQQDAQTRRQIAVEQAKIHRGVVDKQQSQNPDGTWVFKIRNPANPNEVWGEQPAQPPTAMQTRQGTFGDFLKKKEAEVGHPLTSADMTKARNDWAKAGATMTPGDRMAMAKAMANYRFDLGQIEPEDVASLAQSVTIGDDTARYFDVSQISGAKEKNTAMTAARRAGIIPVTGKQAEQLEAAGAANANLTEFMGQIEDKLPKDATGRPLGALTNKLSQFFQTDEELAGAVGWNVSVLPLLQAFRVSGRVPVFEYQQAVQSRPQLGDTVGTAQQKVRNLQAMLRNAALQHLNKGQQGTSGLGGSGGTTPPTTAPATAPGAAPGTPGASANPAPYSTALRTKARQALVKAGRKADPATIDLFLQKNPEKMIDDFLAQKVVKPAA
jgi:hypothetical protein